MAYPVAVYYAADPPPRPRGGPGSAQIVEIDQFRSQRTGTASGSQPRYDSYVDPQERAAQHARENDRTAHAERVARGTRARNTSFNLRYDSGDERDEFFAEAGKRRAPSSLRFAAQSIGQENVPEELPTERFSPAIAAYTIAARHGIPGGDPTALNGLKLSVYA